MAFHYFIFHNDTSRTSLFIIDKDFNNVELIRQHFPHVAIHLCLFHVLKNIQAENTIYPQLYKRS